MNLFALTRELIDIPSLTGSEMEIANFLMSHLTNKGYNVELQEVADGRANVIATTTGVARVFLSTHMDTVPPHLSATEDANYIYGRGACDAKGIIAAQIFAAEQLRGEGVNNMGLLFTVDEEAGSEGAITANSHPLAASCEYLINGEPTDNKLTIGSKGSLRLRIKAEGRAAHSAYPELGHSAIDTLLDVLADIRRCTWPTDETLGDTTCNIGTIKGGTRANVIPDAAEADLQIRLVTSTTLVKETLERIVGSRARVEYLSGAEPQQMLSLSEFETSVVSFTTDIPYLTNWGTPLLIGPGSILDAHTDHERIDKRELTAAVDLYARLVRTLVADGAESSL
jgi:acetylornithine deacetylase